MSMGNKGMVSGNQEVPLKQRPSTNELLVQLVNAGIQIDPTQITIIGPVSIVPNQEDKFDQIITELKKMNTYLANISDMVVKEEDIILDKEDIGV